MGQLPWHNYAGESAEQLLALATTRRLDSLAVAFEMAIDQKLSKLGSQSLSEPERDVLAIEGLEREVNNGGYRQFLSNSSNEYAAIVVAALQRIGCTRTATITQQALAALPRETVFSAESLGAEMARENSERDARLDSCDQEYYAAGEDIASALLKYLERHRSELRLL
jgi:hypothetical protein